MKDLFLIRRENLHKLVMDRFNGNKSAFGRATEVHHNHVNLLLSNNETYRRNLGEELARRIEAALGLPDKWLDTGHVGNQKTFDVKAKPIDQILSRAIVASDDVTSVTLTDKWMATMGQQITDPSNLILASVSTMEMAPTLQFGSTVIIDTGYKSASVDGIYVLTKGDTGFIRSVRRTTDGQQLFADNPAYRTEKPELLKGMKIVGRIVVKNTLERV